MFPFRINKHYFNSFVSINLHLFPQKQFNTGVIRTNKTAVVVNWEINKFKHKLWSQSLGQMPVILHVHGVTLHGLLTLSELVSQQQHGKMNE